MKWSVPSSQKLVAFLQGQLGDYSGKFLRRLLEANLCRINGQVERFGSRVVRRGDAVELAPHWKSLLPSPSLAIEAIYEDDSLKIVNKPAGWICDPKQAQQTFGPGYELVHRLDKETTGLLILAKNRSAREGLKELFAKRQIVKNYWALVDGVPSAERGERRSFFIKKGAYQGQTLWGSGPRGALAITRWKRVAVGEQAALLDCEPETGRTHQIRVHLCEMGHPILIDRQYASSFRCKLFISRTLLHAYRLRFSFQETAIDVTAPLFPDMEGALRGVGISIA